MITTLIADVALHDSAVGVTHLASLSSQQVLDIAHGSVVVR